MRKILPTTGTRAVGATISSDCTKISVSWAAVRAFSASPAVLLASARRKVQSASSESAMVCTGIPVAPSSGAVFANRSRAAVAFAMGEAERSTLPSVNNTTLVR